MVLLFGSLFEFPTNGHLIGAIVSDPQNSGEFNKNRDNGRKPSLENHNVPRHKQHIRDNLITPPKDRKGEQMKKQEAVTKKQEPMMKKPAAVAKPNKPSFGESGPGRPTKPSVDQYQMKPEQKCDKGTSQKRELPSHPNVSIIIDHI